MSDPRTINPIFSAKQSQHVTLVPNRRVFELELAKAFQQPGEMQAGAMQVVVAPALHVMSSWVEQISVQIDLLNGQPLAASIDRLRLNHIWQETVSKDPGWLSTFEAQTLAKSARNADRLIRHWYVSGETPGLSPRFNSWRHSVRKRLLERQLFTAEDWLVHLKIQLDQAGELPIRLPGRVTLRGFFELTGLEQKLLTALQGHGVQVIDAEENFPAQLPAPRHQGHSYESVNDEFRAVAYWASHCIDLGYQRIAVVVNDLDALAPQLLSTFDRVVPGRDSLQIQVMGDSLFHLPGHGRLADQAVIKDALLFLRIAVGGSSSLFPFPDISQFLLSPHLAGWDGERHARGLFEIALREEGLYELSISDLTRQLGRLGFAARLPVLNDLFSSASSLSCDSEISQSLLKHLLNLGWPGPWVSGSLVQNRLGKFTGLLERLRQQAPDSVQLALSLLSQWCGDTRLTERGGPLSPIQILSPEDAAGEQFQAAWFMNVHDGNWPGQPLSNPFLPQGVAHYLPRSTPAGELAFTRKLQGKLDFIAPEIHYSWSNTSGDVPRMASQLLAESITIEAAGSTHPALLPWPALSGAEGIGKLSGYAAHPWLVAVKDEAGPALPPGDEARIPGGSAMFRDQSACPLMAFFLHRHKLRLEPMPGPFAGYAYRGKLLHEALYQLFLEQVGRSGLADRSRIEPAVELAMRKHHARRRLAATACRAEQQRLERLLQQWLNFESTRQGFRIKALEERLSFDMDGFRIDLRMDRIDELEDGRQLIIDYKSGGTNARSWLNDRTGEPQLPLYAVLLDRQKPGSVGGLSLASVRAGACELSGVVDEAGCTVSKLYSMENGRSAFARQFETWEELLDHWRSGIDSLKEEILKGHAANILYQEDGLRYAGLDTVLRRSEGEAWLLAHE